MLLICLLVWAAAAVWMIHWVLDELSQPGW